MTSTCIYASRDRHTCRHPNLELRCLRTVVGTGTSCHNELHVQGYHVCSLPVLCTTIKGSCTQNSGAAWFIASVALASTMRQQPPLASRLTISPSPAPVRKRTKHKRTHVRGKQSRQGFNIWSGSEICCRHGQVGMRKSRSMFDAEGRLEDLWRTHECHAVL